MKLKTISLALISGLFAFSANASDCLPAGHSDANGMMMNAAAMKQDGEHAVLWNFRTKQCQAFSEISSELGFSSLLPSDEETQGLYSLFRSQGMSQQAALQRVYQFEMANHLTYGVASR